MGWNNLPTRLLRGEFVGWLFKHKFYKNDYPLSKIRKNNCQTAMGRVVMKTTIQKSQNPASIF